MNALDLKIRDWVSEGLITPEQGEGLRRREETAPGSPTAGLAPSSRALIGEVVGYLGAILAVSAVAFMLRETWSSMGTGPRVGLVAALTVVVALAGVVASRVDKSPAQRLASVLLLATVALSGWLTWVVVDQAAGFADRATVLWVTGVLTAVAAIIYLLRNRALAQLALLGSIMALIAAAFSFPNERVDFMWVGLTWAVLGAVWVGLSMGDLLKPDRVGLVAGGFVVLSGLQSSTDGDPRGWMLGAGVAAAVAMLGISVMRRGDAALIVPGAVGLLINLPQLIDYLFADSLATWLGVLITGVGLVGLAVWMVRGRKGAARGTTEDPESIAPS